MKETPKTLEFKFERTIPAPPNQVFDGWLDPKIPGNIWNAAEKFRVDPKVDGLYYWLLKGTAHYGRFTQFKRPGRLQHTWVSPNTLGLETLVTVAFQKKGKGTQMTLVHSGLPDHEKALGHKRGWNYFLGVFLEQFGTGSRKEFSWEEAHASLKK